MRRTDVTPTGVERTFHPDQIIVSKTDLRGRITYVNKLFVETSAYAEDDLLGKPHNVIRHPDMPRAIFALVWERLEAGEEIFGYVVNMAHDGAHYWVLAHFTPTVDGTGRTIGYHSNRRSVTKAQSTMIAALYREICAAEAPQPNARAAVEAGRRVLDRKLEELGMTYDEFLWSIANAEVDAA